LSQELAAVNGAAPENPASEDEAKPEKLNGANEMVFRVGVVEDVAQHVACSKKGIASVPAT
jgi:hypothetical protein